MSEIFAMVEGEFGKVVVIEVQHSLVPHAHSEIQMIYWLGGGHCQVQVGDERVVCDETIAIGVNRYQAHDMTLAPSAAPSMMLKLHLHESWFDANLNTQDEPVVFLTAQLKVTDEVKAKYCALMQKTLFAAQADKAQIADDVKALLQLTLQSNRESVLSSSIARRRKMVDYRLRLALSYMRLNFEEADLINSLTKAVGLSRSRLYELFKNELQTTPKLVRNSVLIDSAINGMRQPYVNFSLLSSKLGFSTAANFSRFFRGHKGVTPSAYRKKLRVSAQQESAVA